MLTTTASFAQTKSVDSLSSQETVDYIKYEIDAGVLLMYDFNGSVDHGFQISNGIHIGTYVYAGLGVGLNIYKSNFDGYNFNSFKYLPVFLNVRFSFWRPGIAPYVSCRFGYSISLLSSGRSPGGLANNSDPSEDNGFIIDASAGVEIHIFHSLNYLLGIGFLHQDASSYYFLPTGILTIETGISF
jgi:hypothetical protein